MKSHFFLLLVVLFLGSACNNGPQEEASPEKEEGLDLKAVLPGTWEENTRSVLILSSEGIEDSVISYQIRENDWQNVFQTSPPHYAFRPDNKYRVYYRDINGNRSDSSAGMWNAFGDTLLLISPDETIQYRVRYKDGSLAEFRAVMDGDKDGVEDDQYQSTLRKVSNSAF